MALIIKLIIGFALVYAAVVVLVAWRQRDIMYFPDPRRVTPTEARISEFSEVEIATPGGETIIAWHHPPAIDGGVTLLHFHGNGGSIAMRAARYQMFANAGFGVLAVSYRGYGGSSGQPSEAGLINDGLAAYDWLAGKKAGPIALYGESLGTAVAVQVAADRPIAALVLEAPANSLLEVAQRAYPFLPVAWLMKDRFRSDQRIAGIQAPILMVHGRRDTVIPFDLGEKLFRLANEPKRFIAIDEAGHNDLWEHGMGNLAITFLNEVSQ